VSVSFFKIELSGPGELDALTSKPLLKTLGLGGDGLWDGIVLKAPRGEKRGGFSNVPFDRMQTITTVGDVC